MAQVIRLTTRQQTTDRTSLADAAEQLRQLGPELLAQLPGSHRLLISRAIHTLHRHAHPDAPGSTWPGGFTMLNRNQTKAVWDAIRALPPKDRPVQVRDAFMLLMLNLRQDTGECVLTREEIAEQIGCKPNEISRIMSTLVRMGVLRRDLTRVEGMRGRGIVTYVVNADVAWNGHLEARKEAAKTLGKADLKLVQNDNKSSNDTV